MGIWFTAKLGFPLSSRSHFHNGRWWRLVCKETLANSKFIGCANKCQVGSCLLELQCFWHSFQLDVLTLFAARQISWLPLSPGALLSGNHVLNVTTYNWAVSNFSPDQQVTNPHDQIVLRFLNLITTLLSDCLLISASRHILT